jgi:His-Xaa-Ser system protein HxsD
MSPDPALRLRLDTLLYPRQAILRVCYWLAERATISLSRIDAQTIEVLLRPKGGGDTGVLREAFEAALIDFSIRADVEQRTSDLRTLVWNVAFAEAGLRDTDRS